MHQSQGRKRRRQTDLVVSWRRLFLVQSQSIWVQLPVVTFALQSAVNSHRFTRSTKHQQNELKIENNCSTKTNRCTILEKILHSLHKQLYRRFSPATPLNSLGIVLFPRNCATINTRKCGSEMLSVASVCVSVCPVRALIFESLNSCINPLKGRGVKWLHVAIQV